MIAPIPQPAITPDHPPRKLVLRGRVANVQTVTVLQRLAGISNRKNAVAFCGFPAGTVHACFARAKKYGAEREFEIVLAVCECEWYQALPRADYSWLLDWFEPQKEQKDAN